MKLVPNIYLLNFWAFVTYLHSNKIQKDLKLQNILLAIKGLTNCIAKTICG